MEFAVRRSERLLSAVPFTVIPVDTSRSSWTFVNESTASHVLLDSTTANSCWSCWSSAHGLAIITSCSLVGLGLGLGLASFRHSRDTSSAKTTITPKKQERTKETDPSSYDRLVGGTPLIKLEKLSQITGRNIFVKVRPTTPAPVHLRSKALILILIDIYRWKA